MCIDPCACLSFLRIVDHGKRTSTNFYTGQSPRKCATTHDAGQLTQQFHLGPESKNNLYSSKIAVRMTAFSWGILTIWMRVWSAYRASQGLNETAPRLINMRGPFVVFHHIDIPRELLTQYEFQDESHVWQVENYASNSVLSISTVTCSSISWPPTFTWCKIRRI